MADGSENFTCPSTMSEGELRNQGAEFYFNLMSPEQLLDELGRFRAELAEKLDMDEKLIDLSQVERLIINKAGVTEVRSALMGIKERLELEYLDREFPHRDSSWGRMIGHDPLAA